MLGLICLNNLAKMDAMRKFAPLLFLIVFLLGAWQLSRYLAFGNNKFLNQGQIMIAPSPSPQSEATLSSSMGRLVTVSKNVLSALLKQNEKSSAAPVDYQVESFVENLNVPWSVVFTSPTRALVTERPGRVRVIENGKLLAQPIKVLNVSNQSEEGLMGMTLDPNYQQNKYLYLCYAYVDGGVFDQVVRLTDKGHELAEEKIIINKIPAAEFHAGCRLRFSPDGKLFISTGDARQRQLPQDLNSVAGKILRLNADGSIPSDNPFGNSPVYSYGHRNSQGFDWNPISGIMVATEHGPSGVDGPGGGDELNIIEPGQNYGWPIVSHRQSKEGMVSPLLGWTPAIAPASGMFYTGTVFPQFTNNFFFGMLRGAGISRVVFDLNNPEAVVSYEKLPGVDVGRVRDIVQGPDGLLYFTTSNRDGRGTVYPNDDHIYRLVPKQ